MNQNVNLSPDKALSFAESEMNAHRFDAALNILHQLEPQLPTRNEIPLFIGVCFLHKNDLENAAKAISLSLFKGNQHALYWLGVLKDVAKLPAWARPEQLRFEGYRRSPYMDYPEEVHIETLSVCNAACTSCPYPGIERKGNRMSEALIEKIINDLKEIPKNVKFNICPFKVSDPFLDKRIFDISKKINLELPNAVLRFFTNGSALTESMLQRFEELQGTEQLWISLNHHEPEGYTEFMKLPYQRTIDNLHMVHKAAEEKRLTSPVVLSRVGDNSPDDKAFVDFVKNTFPLFSPFVIRRGNWTGQVEVSEHEIIQPTGCVRWFQLSIMSTGQVALCCMDGEGKHVIGDVNEQSVLDVYNAPGYRKMREHHSSRLAAAAPCDTCTG